MQRVQESETLLSTLQQAFSDAKRNTQEQMVSSIFICELCIACSCQLCLDLNISSGKSAHIQINAQITDSRSLIRRVARLNCTSEALMIGFAFFCLYRSNFTVPPQLQIFADVTELVAKEYFASVSKSCSCLQEKCTAEENVIYITK